MSRLIFLRPMWRDNLRVWCSAYWWDYHWRQQRRIHASPVRAFFSAVAEHFKPLPF